MATKKLARRLGIHRLEHFTEDARIQRFQFGAHARAALQKEAERLDMRYSKQIPDKEMRTYVIRIMLTEVLLYEIKNLYKK